MNLKYINIHTHKSSGGLETLELLNIYPEDFSSIHNPEFISIGIHPWFISSNPDEQLNLLRSAVAKLHPAAIGECGLDRKKGVSFEVQKYVFAEQIRIAAALNLPLIIHCAGAYPELIAAKNASSPRLNWIIHGFNSNISVLNELIKHGFFISAGPRLLNGKAEIISQIPDERLFIETDDAPQSIKEIYAQIAALKKLSVEELISIVSANFKRLFTDPHL